VGKSNVFKVGHKSQSMFIFAERQKENSLVMVMKKWIQKAMDLAREEDKIELQNAVGRYLSPKFLRIRDSYLKELDKISKLGLNESSMSLTKKCAVRKKNMSEKTDVNKIQILLPVEFLKKKLRDIGILNKFSSRPMGKLIFSYLKDYDIISWYSTKAKGL
jgi:hypothetical protein